MQFTDLGANCTVLSDCAPEKSGHVDFRAGNLHEMDTRNSGLNLIVSRSALHFRNKFDLDRAQFKIKPKKKNETIFR